MDEHDISRNEYENDPEYNRDQYYFHDLDMFEGNDSYHIGIIDDLINIKRLIELIGRSVIPEEQEYAKIWAERDQEMVVMPGDDVTENYYRKLFRPFSYRAIFMLVQSVFENGLEDLRALMIKAGRYKSDGKNKILMDILKEFQKYPGYTGEHHNKLRMFNFLRNKVAHNNGRFIKDGEKVQFHELERFVKSRDDIELKEISETGYSHQVIILQSTLLVEYIDLINEIITQLLKVARRAPFLGWPPQK